MRELDKTTIGLVGIGLLFVVSGATLFTYSSQSYDHTVRVADGESSADFNYPNLSSEGKRAFSTALEGLDESDPYDDSTFSVKNEKNRPSEFRYSSESFSRYVIRYNGSLYELSTYRYREDPTIGQPIFSGLLFILGLGISAVGLKNSHSRGFRASVFLGIITAVAVTVFNINIFNSSSRIAEVGVNLLFTLAIIVFYYILFDTINSGQEDS